MTIADILNELDTEIQRLTQARTILSGEAVQKMRLKPGPKKKKHSNISPEGRKRIAEAMRRRWAEGRGKPGQKAKKKATSAAG